MIKKTPNKLVLEGTYLNTNKGHIWQDHSKHHAQWWKVENFRSTIRNETRLITLTTSIQHKLEVLAREIRQEKEITGIRIGKDEIKLSLFANDIIFYLKNPEDSNKTWLDLVNEFSKVAVQY